MTPALSVAVAASGRTGVCAGLFESLAPHLENGTVEVVVATADPSVRELSEPAATRVVRCAPGTPLPRLRAVALAASQARLVALTEGSCVPVPGWSNALLRAHTQVDPWTATVAAARTGR